VFKLGLERSPLDEAADLASAATFSRLENAATARDLYRKAHAFVDQFLGSYQWQRVVAVGAANCRDRAQGSIVCRK
jgi:hypothetical protein